MTSMKLFKTIIYYPVNNFLATGIHFERESTLSEIIQKNPRYYEGKMSYVQGLEHAAVHYESKERDLVYYWEYYKDYGLVYELALQAPWDSSGLLKIGARLIPARKSPRSKYFEWDKETPIRFNLPVESDSATDELGLDAIVKGYSINPHHLRALRQEERTQSHRKLDRYATQRWNSLHVHLLHYSYDEGCDQTLATYLFNPTAERRAAIMKLYSPIITVLREHWLLVCESMQILDAAFGLTPEYSTTRVFATVEASRRKCVRDLCDAANGIITKIRSKHALLFESFARILTGGYSS